MVKQWCIFDVRETTENVINISVNLKIWAFKFISYNPIYVLLMMLKTLRLKKKELKRPNNNLCLFYLYHVILSISVIFTFLISNCILHVNIKFSHLPYKSCFQVILPSYTSLELSDFHSIVFHPQQDLLAQTSKGANSYNGYPFELFPVFLKGSLSINTWLKIRLCIRPYFYFKGIMVYPLFFLAVMHSNLHPFLSHPNSQNNGGPTLHIDLKFPTKCVTTLHPWNKPNKGGYTILNPHWGRIFLVR